MTTTTDVYSKLLEYADSEGDLVSAIFDGIAAAGYPNDSFEQLVDEVRAFSPELADAIKDNGINFSVVAQGERHRASAWVERETINVDLEEWLQDIPDELDEIEDEFADELMTARENFASAVIVEVYAELQKLGVTPEEVLEHFRTYGRLNPAEVKVGRFWRYTGNHPSGRDCDRNGDVVSELAQALYYAHTADQSMFENVVINEAEGSSFGYEVSVAAPQSVWDACQESCF